MTEGIQRRRLLVPVALALILRRERAVVVVDHRHLADVPGPGERQASRRADVAEEHRRHGLAAAGARVPGLDDGRDLPLDPAKVDRAPGHQHHDHRRPRRDQRLDLLHRAAGQVEGAHGALLADLVLALPGDDDRDVRGLGQLDGAGELGVVVVLVGGLLEEGLHPVEHRREHAARDSHAGRVVDDGGVAHAGADAVEKDDGLRGVVVEDPGAEHVSPARGQLADDGDPGRGRGVQRERAVVAQQHHRPLRRRAGGVAVVGAAEDLGGGVNVDVGALEQAERELRREHAANRLVEGGLVDLPLRHGAREMGEGGIGHGHLHVEAGAKRARPGVGGVGREVLGLQRLDRVGVADHEALEAPLVAQHVGQQPAVPRCGDPVEIHVGAHDVGRTRVDGGLERREVDVAQLRVGDVRVVVVSAAAGRAVAGEVFGAGQDALRPEVSLEAADLGGGHRGGQHRILPRALDDATPAGVPRDVDHGGERPVDADGAGLARGDSLALLRRRGVPGRGGRDRHREDRAEAVDDVEAEEQRDAQPRVLDGAALQAVGQRGVAHEQHRADGARAHAPGHHPRAPGIGLLLGRQRGDVEIVGHLLRREEEELGQLTRLLLHRHAPEQVLDALGDGKVRVSVRLGHAGVLSGLGTDSFTPRKRARCRNGKMSAPLSTFE